MKKYNMKYYSTQRSIGPGTFPVWYGVVKIHNFDRRTFCEEIGREAWGCIEFVAESIPDDVVAQYELTGGKAR